MPTPSLGRARTCSAGPPAPSARSPHPGRIPNPATAPGQIVGLTVHFTADSLAGTSIAHAKMADQHNRLHFPERHHIGLRVEVVVTEPRERSKR